MPTVFTFMQTKKRRKALVDKSTNKIQQEIKKSKQSTVHNKQILQNATPCLTKQPSSSYHPYVDHNYAVGSPTKVKVNMLVEEIEKKNIILCKAKRREKTLSAKSINVID